VEQSVRKMYEELSDHNKFSYEYPPTYMMPSWYLIIYFPLSISYLFKFQTKIEGMKQTVKNVKADKTSKYIHLKQIAQMTLGSGNMNLAV